jgi:hypothetical protein
MRKMGLVLGLLTAAALLTGCQSSGKTTASARIGETMMKCAGCGKSVEAGDMALTCICGATMTAGDVKCRCPKCQYDCKAEKCKAKCPACGAAVDCGKMQATGGTMTCTCGKIITCNDLVCACPKCGGAMTCDVKCAKCGKEMTCSDKCMACAAKK